MSTSITIEEFTQIKQEYFDAIPEGDALKAQLKSHNKEQKARHAQIYQYMRENNVMSTDLGGVTFEREEKTTVPAVSLKMSISIHIICIFENNVREFD